MENYRKGSHTVHDLKYHLVWITKYRYNVLHGDIALRVRTIIREVCMSYDIKIIKGVVSKNHIHLLLSAPPMLAPSKFAQLLKGKSSYKIQQEFPELKKRYWGQHIWARGYFCTTTGNVSDEMIKDYLDKHKSNEVKDDFVVE